MSGDEARHAFTPVKQIFDRANTFTVNTHICLIYNQEQCIRLGTHTQTIATPQTTTYSNSSGFEKSNFIYLPHAQSFAALVHARSLFNYSKLSENFCYFLYWPLLKNYAKIAVWKYFVRSYLSIIIETTIRFFSTVQDLKKKKINEL